SRRSGSVPVSALTRVDLPWSMWPAVPMMTCLEVSIARIEWAEEDANGRAAAGQIRGASDGNRTPRKSGYLRFARLLHRGFLLERRSCSGTFEFGFAEFRDPNSGIDVIEED